MNKGAGHYHMVFALGECIRDDGLALELTHMYGPKTLVLGLVDMPHTAVLALPQECGA